MLDLLASFCCPLLGTQLQLLAIHPMTIGFEQPRAALLWACFCYSL